MIYVYKCDSCGKEFEVIKPISEATRPEQCAQCGKVARRVYVPFYLTWGQGGWDWDNQGLGDNLILRHHD